MVEFDDQGRSILRSLQSLLSSSVSQERPGVSELDSPGPSAHPIRLCLGGLQEFPQAKEIQNFRHKTNNSCSQPLYPRVDKYSPSLLGRSTNSAPPMSGGLLALGIGRRKKCWKKWKCGKMPRKASHKWVKIERWRMDWGGGQMMQLDSPEA